MIWAWNSSLISFKLRGDFPANKLTFKLLVILKHHLCVSLGLFFTLLLGSCVVSTQCFTFNSCSNSRLISYRLRKVKKRRSWREDYLRSCWRCSWTQNPFTIAWPMTWPIQCRGRVLGRRTPVLSGKRYLSQLRAGFATRTIYGPVWLL